MNISLKAVKPINFWGKVVKINKTDYKELKKKTPKN